MDILKQTNTNLRIKHVKSRTYITTLFNKTSLNMRWIDVHDN